MAETKLTIAEIKDLMRQMNENGLQKLTLRNGDFELKLEAPASGAAVSSASVPQSVSLRTDVSCETAVSIQQEPEGSVVKSPIVGTFYASPAPDKPPFVTVGSKVKKGDVLFVIESMKLMNEIQSEYDGEVAEILVEDAQGVEYNQPILLIR